MKKLLLTTALLAVTALGVFAQGTTVWDSSANSDAGAAATSNGQWWINTGSGATLLNADVNAELFGGTVSGSLQPLATLLLSNGSAAGDITFYGHGKFLDNSGNEYNVPGSAANGNAILMIEAWTGAFSSYAAASAGGAYVGTTGEFTQKLGGAGTPAPGLSSMPAIVLQTIPEPSTFALAGLGAAALLIFRRRK